MILQRCQKFLTFTILAIVLASSLTSSAEDSKNDPYILANQSLAQRFLDKEEYDQAIQRFRLASEADQNNPVPKIGLASAYRKSGKTEPALELLLPLATAENSPLAMAELGTTHLQLKQYEEAKKWFLAAEPALPENSNLQLLLGSTFLAQGELTSAMPCFQKAAKDLPQESQKLIEQTNQRFNQSKETFMKAMQAHHEFQQGKPSNPWNLYRKTLELNSDVVPALNNLAWHLATTKIESQRNGSEALRLAQKAVTLSGGKEPGFLETLAAAQAATGNFEGAIKTATSILNNPKAPNIAKHLELYQKKTPLRE